MPKPGSIADVVPGGDVYASLVAIRDRLAAETDDLTWDKHKRECRCVCGIANPGALVALTKRIEDTMAAIEALPKPETVVSDVDRAMDAARARRDDLAQRRAHRGAEAPAS